MASGDLIESDASQSQQKQQTTHTENEVLNESKGKKRNIRRAFSMPRNPFRLSRRVKITTIAKNDQIVEGDDTIMAPATNNCNQSFHSIDGNCNGSNNNSTTVTIVKNNTLPTGTTTATMNGTTNILYTGASQSQSQQKQQQEHEQDNKHRMFRRSAWKKFLSRIAQQMTSSNIGAKQSATLDRRVPPFGGYAWPPDQVPGVTGLKNHGNTCFMNAVLQCLSHTDILAEYFVLDQYKADLKRRNKINSRKFGTKGELTEQLALVLKALWTCKNESDYSTSFKAVVDRYGSQFRSSTQHDAQEFLFWLLDKVHEDLNTASKRKYKSVKNNYGRPDEVIAAETLANHIRCNNSFVQAVFQAQFRSSLACPRCHKQSNTFDPFHCVSVQLPQLAQQAVFVTVLYATQHPRQVKLGLSVPPGSPIIALREQLQADTGIPLDRMVLTEIQETGFVRVFCDSHPMSSLSKDDQIYCIETPGDSNATNIEGPIDSGTTKENGMTAINDTTTNLTLIIANVKRLSAKDNDVKRFSTPICIQVNRDISYTALQKKLLKEMQTILKTEIFTFSTSIANMFKIRLQDPSADPDTYIESNVEHPLFTEMIDLALSVLPVDAGPPHVKLLLEWNDPDNFFCDTTDPFVVHESVSQLEEKFKDNTTLTLEQCLEHYTKAETLSAEDAWRCPHCQKYLPVVKTLGLWSLPDILVIHFKRFRQQHLKGPQSAKLTTTVTFPLTDFDMSPHLARGSNGTLNGSVEDNWSPWKKLKRRDLTGQMKDNRYDLYAVCYHQGDTLETGHYTAACKNPYDHQWYKFDDQKVNVVPADQMPEEIVNNEAYILFYQRRKFDNAECSGSSSGSSDHWVSKISVAPNSTSRNASVRASAATLNLDDKRENGADEMCPVGDEPLKIKKLSQEDLTANHSKIIENDVENQNDACSESEVKHIVVEINSAPQPELPIKIEPTNEDEIVDIESLDAEISKDEPIQSPSPKLLPEAIRKSPVMDVTETVCVSETNKLLDSPEDEIDIEVQLRNITIKQDETKLSTSYPTQRSLWPFDSNHTIHTYTPMLNRGSLNFGEMLSNNLRRDRDAHLRHSLSTSLSRNDKNAMVAVAANDTFAMLRGVSSCSKDTLIYIDQQNHRSLIEEDTNYMSNRSLWISPVTPHKLITVSPKN